MQIVKCFLQLSLAFSCSSFRKHLHLQALQEREMDGMNINLLRGVVPPRGERCQFGKQINELIQGLWDGEGIKINAVSFTIKLAQ